MACSIPASAGLTVLRALVTDLLANFLYLGDTARLPIAQGPKRCAYSVRAAEALVERGIKAWSSPATRPPRVRRPCARFPDLPVIGVIEAKGAAATASASGAASGARHRGDGKGGAYQRTIHALRPDAHVTQVAARSSSRRAGAGEAIDAVTSATSRPRRTRDTVVLGCTRLPLLAAAIASNWDPREVVDSAHRARDASGVDRPLATFRHGAGTRTLHRDRQSRAVRPRRRTISGFVHCREECRELILDTFHSTVKPRPPAQVLGKDKGRSG